MKAGYTKKTVTPLKKWKTNFSQQIKELLNNASQETRIIEFSGNWDGLQFDSAKVWVHKADIEMLSKYLSIN